MWFNILCSVFHSDSGLNRDEDQEFMSALLLLFYPGEGMVKSQILVHPNQILLQFFCQKSMLTPAAHVPVQWWWRAGKSFTPLLFSLRGITECSWIPPTPEQQQYVNNNVSDPDGFFFLPQSRLAVQNYRALLRKYSRQSVWQGTGQETASRHPRTW